MSTASQAGPSHRIAALDGLRGIAVGLVLVHHFIQLPLPRVPGSWQAYLAAGLGLSFSGVDLFFVISGFLIGGIVLDNRAASNFYGVFYLRRTLRIVPLYYVFLLVCWGLAAIAPGMAHPTYPLASYLVFLANISMTLGNSWDAGFPSLAWSLAVEEQFYLGLPLLARIVTPRFLCFLALASLAFAPLARTLILLGWPEFSLGTHILLPCRMDSLAFGLLAAMALRTRIFAAWLKVNPYAPTLAAAALVPLIAWLTLKRVGPETLAMALVGYSALGAFYAAILLSVVGGKPSLLARLCQSRPLTFLGRISYFVYLFQGIAAWVTFRLAGGTGDASLKSFADILLAMLALAGLFLAGAASWKYFESRLLAIGRRFKYRAANETPPAILPVAG